jgi:hypothetical protein
MTDPTLIIAMILILFVFSIVCFLSVLLYFLKRRMRNATTSGIISNVRLGLTFSRRLIGYTPDVEFTDRNGEKHFFMSSVSSFPVSSYKEGDKVKIFYNPDNPSEAEIGSGWEAFFRQIFFPFGLLFAGIFSFSSSILLIGAYILFFKIVPFLNSY